MRCLQCGADNRPGSRFCRQCGTPLDGRCQQCNAPLDPGDAYCPACGRAVADRDSAPPGEAGPQLADLAATTITERRRVSVVFVDLVGFTMLAQGLDPEDVRELLSRYFDRSRLVVERYGGVVEKFIGDAVMAVWGAPLAREDDTERAVRAALDLVDAVRDLGREAGMTDLAARAGIVTGDTAVTIGAVGQGLVAGDAVNTASRLQSLAPPGAVVVDEPTRRSTEAAVVYADLGEHPLKGRTGTVRVWRAHRVVARVGGGSRGGRDEAPFVGREADLRLVKDLFHASVADRRARLLSVLGPPGSGKSRLAWEFLKYIDGVVEVVHWHSGRCLPYGEGVTYWALAEMVRGRCGIVDDDAREEAVAKLEATVERFVPEPAERRRVYPRLAHLLGLGGEVASREDLFSAWRLFFERVAIAAPAVLVLEDAQWADASLLDFLDHLLDWSRDTPLFLVVLARSEFTDQHPGWGGGQRNAMSTHLAPMSAAAVAQLLDGLVPGLPREARDRLAASAEGVPLYAVETVRMLVDRGILKEKGGRFSLVEPLADLDVPDTLHAIIAARLDALPADERGVLQRAAILGQTFLPAALAAVMRRTEDAVRPALAALERKEFLELTVDPLTSERGQYAFLQQLVRKVAYETLSRRDRKDLHLAAAEHLSLASGTAVDEVPEMVASHYVDAYLADPDSTDAEALRVLALEHLVAAGDRAADLAAPSAARRYFERAAELEQEPVARGQLLQRAGEMAYQGGDGLDAEALLGNARALFDEAGDARSAARAAARLGFVLQRMGHLEESLRLLDNASTVLGDADDADAADIATVHGQLLFMAGQHRAALRRLDEALDIAERENLPHLVAEALDSKGCSLLFLGRPIEARLLLEGSLALAREHDFGRSTLRALNNLAECHSMLDRYADSASCLRESVAIARRLGLRGDEHFGRANLIGKLWLTGEWDESLETVRALEDVDLSADVVTQSLLGDANRIHVARGNPGNVRRPSEAVLAAGRSDAQARGQVVVTQAVLALVDGDVDTAYQRSTEALLSGWSSGQAGILDSLSDATDAALSSGRIVDLRALLDGPLAHLERRGTPAVLAHVERARGRIAVADGRRGDADGHLRVAAERFRQAGTPFWAAVTDLERAENLIENERRDEAPALLEPARETFGRLGARPWLERVDLAAATLTRADPDRPQ